MRSRTLGSVRSFLRWSLAVAAAIVLPAAALAQPVERPQIPFTGSKKWALVIGASDYKELGKLRFAASDARAFSQALVDGYGFDPATVRVLADGGDPKDAPSSANILGALDALLKDRRLDQGDLFVFYFAGHGAGIEGGDYLLPTDATKATMGQVGVNVKDIIERFVKSGLKNVLIVADACRSGKEHPFGARLQELGKKANIAVFLGCAPGARSYEYPRLNHGVFTHFLLQAIKNQSLRDETSGALWASNVAKKVARDVEEYTERDYGDDRQIPAVWTEKTQDVLLGAFVATGEVTEGALKIVLEKSKSLDKRLYAKMLLGLGLTYSSFDMNEPAIEVLKTLDQIGEASPMSLYALSLALTEIGRDAEAQRIQERLIRNAPDSTIRDLAIVDSASPLVTPEMRRKSALALYEDDRNWRAAQVLFYVHRHEAPVATAELRLLLKRLVADFGPQSRIGLYFAAQDAVAAADYLSAMKHISQAFKLEGAEPELNDYLVLMYEIFQWTGQEAQIDRLIETAMKNPKHRGFWAQIALSRAAKKSETERLSLLEKTIAECQSPYVLLESVASAGPLAVRIAKQVEDASKRFPFAWESHLAKWLARMADGFPLPITLPEEAFKYAKDPVDLYDQAFASLGDLLDACEEAQSVGEEKAESVRQAMLAGLMPHVPAFGTHHRRWMHLRELLTDLKRPLQMGALARAYLYPLALKAGSSTKLRHEALEAALASGDHDWAKKLYESGSWDGPDSFAEHLRWAIHMATRSLGPEIGQRFSTLSRPAERRLAEMYDALRLLVLARTGKHKEALDGLDQSKFSNLVAQQIAGCARIEAGDVKNGGVQGLDLLGSSNPQYLDVYAFLLFQMQSMLYSLKDPELGKIADSLGSMAVEKMGHPLFRAVGFGTDPTVKPFVGMHRFEGSLYADGQKPAPTEVVVEVGPKGSAKGKLIVGKDRTIEFEATVDFRGNLSGSMKGPEGPWTVSAKLAPIGLHKKSEMLAESGQPIAFYDAKGGYMVFKGKHSP